MSDGDEQPQGAEDVVEDDGEEELIAVARIAKVRGIRGEVAADLLTDFPERFDGLEALISLNAAGERDVL